VAHSLTYGGDPPPPRFNLARHCLAGKPAGKTALIVAGAEPCQLTYGEIEDQVLALAAGLASVGACDGHRLLIRMANGLDYALLFLAAAAAGAVAVPASPMLTAGEVDHLIAEAEISVIAWDGALALPATSARVLTPDDLARLKRHRPGSYADTSANDHAYTIFTSGTGGKAKGVRHGHRAVWGRRPMYRGWYGIGADDIVLHTGAFNWTYTMGTGLIDPLVNGATAVVYAGPRDDQVWERLCRDYGATIFASVPGLYRILLRDGFKPGPRLRHGLTAGEALAPSLLSAWQNRTGLSLYEALGMSEISTYISSSPEVPVRPGSPGKPQPGRAVRIGSDGQIEVHGGDPGLMLGYTNSADLDGSWFATGDAGHFDADGYLWHGGRIDDVMNASGYRVSPLEVENVLALHPDIAEAGVTEIRVSDTLSIIGAFAVPRPGARPDERQVLDFVRERLAQYKWPKQVWFVTALPRNANGKLMRKALRP